MGFGSDEKIIDAKDYSGSVIGSVIGMVMRSIIGVIAYLQTNIMLKLKSDISSITFL